MAGAAVFGASEVEPTRLVGHELHRDGLTHLRDEGFYPERFNRDAVGTVGGVEAEPDAVSLRHRDGRGFELNRDAMTSIVLTSSTVPPPFTCGGHAPAAVTQRASRRTITFLFKKPKRNKRKTFQQRVKNDRGGR